MCTFNCTWPVIDIKTKIAAAKEALCQQYFSCHKGNVKSLLVSTDKASQWYCLIAVIQSRCNNYICRKQSYLSFFSSHLPQKKHKKTIMVVGLKLQVNDDDGEKLFSKQFIMKWISSPPSALDGITQQQQCMMYCFSISCYTFLTAECVDTADVTQTNILVVVFYSTI